VRGTVPLRAFWGVKVAMASTHAEGTFVIDGIGQGLHVVMLTVEPRRGGCFGLAGMMRFARLVPGLPTDPVKLSY
jgi:hypothetical protein